MAKFFYIITSVLLFSLFAISFITFGLRLADSNDAPQSIGDHPAISAYARQLNESLEGYSEEVQDSEDSVAQSPISFLTDNIIFDAIGGIWKAIKNVPTTIINLTIGLLGTVLFSGEFGIVLGILGAIFTLAVIITVWKLVHTGDGA